jgi:hypothetical protein
LGGGSTSAEPLGLPGVSASCSVSAEGLLCLLPSICPRSGVSSSGTSVAGLAGSDDKIESWKCGGRRVWKDGAEMVVLWGERGGIGVDGSSEVDGEDGDNRGWSSARTTIAGVPPCFGLFLLSQGLNDQMVTEFGVYNVVWRSR